MEKRGNAHASPSCASLIRCREGLFLGMIVRNIQGTIEQFSQIDWLGDNLMRSGFLPRLQKISKANLGGRKADGLRTAVHVALHGEQALGRAKSSKGSMGRGVGSDCFRADANIGPVIRSASVN